MTEKKFPTPDEIKKEFEDFVRTRFGGSVQIFSQTTKDHSSEQEQTADVTSPHKDRNIAKLTFNYKPKEIKTYLDRYVIKQDEAKKALAIAVCDHYNHVFHLRDHPETKEDNYAKQNVLLLGPTGVGKTYLVKEVAKLVGVPFVKADATRFTETGYVGANVDDLIRDLVVQADNDIELAQYGIVYLDEADKLASPSEITGRDISGRGVQIGLLKLMEETEVDLSSGNDIRSQMQAFMEFQQRGKIAPKVINTRHILFIVSGAFSGLDKIISQRLNTNKIGFASSNLKSSDLNDYLQFATTEDFVEFGFEPEFIGRLPVRVACQNLTKDDLYHILKHSEGSIIKQYVQSFDSYGVNAHFTEKSLRIIAEKAFKQKTGARALMTVCEEALRAFKFELPSTAISDLEINDKVIENPARELNRLLKNVKVHEDGTLKKLIRAAEQQFNQLYGMKITFDDKAVELIIEKSKKQNLAVKEICEQTLKSYEHGLKLVQQNTGQHSFTLGQDVVINPQAALERLIRDSYQKPEDRLN